MVSMTTLDKKLLRDITQSKGMLVAVGAIIAVQAIIAFAAAQEQPVAVAVRNDPPRILTSTRSAGSERP